jgi:hypothetical protein
MFFRGFSCSSAGEESSGKEMGHTLNSLTLSVDSANSLGLRNMAWKCAGDSALAPKVVDVNWLVEQPDLPFLVQALPAQILHRSLAAHGFDDSLEVVEWIRGRQLVRFMDYELWEYSHESDTKDVSGSQLVQWFRRWLEVGPQFAAERFSELEEDTLVCSLTKILDIEVEGLSRFDAEAHDDYWTTVDGRFHLRVKDGDPVSFEIIKQVVDALYGLDIKWAGSVLSHAAMLVRSESLENALRWREGRLADAGFVPAEEAFASLRPRKMDTLRADIAKAAALEHAKRSYRERVRAKMEAQDISTAEAPVDTEFDAEVLADLAEDVRALLGSMEPEMAVRTLEASLGSAELLRITDGAKLAPEFFVEDEEFLDEAIGRVVAKAKSLLLRVDAVSGRQSRSHRLFAERVFALIAEDNPAESDQLKSRLARVSNMFTAGALGLADSISDADAEARALSVVRGCINIALEMVSSRPQEFGLQLAAEKSADLSVLLGAQVVLLVGPEYLFQLGWSVLSELAVSAAVKFESVLPTTVARPKIAIEVLAHEQRHVDVRRWLFDLESSIATPVFHVISSLVNRVPLYPEVLSLKGAALSASSERRAFETQEDLRNAQAFLESLHRIDVMG